MYQKELRALPRLALRILDLLLLRSYPNYQPVYRAGSLVDGSDRGCRDRWELMKPAFVTHGVKTVVDFGSAEGYYVLQAAKELGCISLGVDADVRRLLMAQNQVVSEKIKPAGFMHAVVDAAFVTLLPSFDAVIFMSVLHHTMYMHGEAYSKNLLMAIREKVGKFMIFEMGQSNETKNAWASKLPDMGSDPHAWIAQFLRSAGFSSVTKIGESSSYQKDQQRAIFLVQR